MVLNCASWVTPSAALKGTNLLRNLHFAGPLSASLQNNTDTLEIDCDSYEKAETYAQAEVNSVVAAAVDALNINQYATDTDVSTAVSDALVLYYTAAQVGAEIAANGFDSSQYWARTESDSRSFVQTANAGFTTMCRRQRSAPCCPKRRSAPTCSSAAPPWSCSATLIQRPKRTGAMCSRAI